MATRTVFTDNEENEMECYLNGQGKVYISIGKDGEDLSYSGFITLNKDDVKQLIKILSDIEQDMTE